MKEFDFEKVPIVEIANEILLDGVKKGASDIHFDPTKDGLNIRMRVDGVLYDYAKVPAEFKRNMVSRIKMIASMNIMETRLPQDGAIKSKIGDKTLDLRVSSLPTYTGEKVVLRILDYSKSLQGLESLGFSAHNLQKIIKMIEVPNGIVLVTGATGSGKSTTVYSILQKLNTREVNIITVEDPVEMEVEGLNQVQAQQEIGLDFANVLRSILRQDPDIIMIGEIRDSETASIAVRASITGHKVLSTIHTNSALNTIERLTDMGVERYLIGTSLNGVISQKLARKLCPHCRTTRPVNDYERMLFKKVTHKDVDQIYEINPDGCEHCFRGYKGRICIAEVLNITDEVRTAITNSESKDVMRKLVYIDAHTHTLLEDGLEKVIEGETNFDEILKLVDLENDLAIHNAFYDEVEAELAEQAREESEYSNEYSYGEYDNQDYEYNQNYTGEEYNENQEYTNNDEYVENQETTETPAEEQTEEQEGVNDEAVVEDTEEQIDESSELQLEPQEVVSEEAIENTNEQNEYTPQEEQIEYTGELPQEEQNDTSNELQLEPQEVVSEDATENTDEQIEYTGELPQEEQNDTSNDSQLESQEVVSEEATVENNDEVPTETVENNDEVPTETVENNDEVPTETVEEKTDSDDPFAQAFVE